MRPRPPLCPPCPTAPWPPPSLLTNTKADMSSEANSIVQRLADRLDDTVTSEMRSPETCRKQNVGDKGLKTMPILGRSMFNKITAHTRLWQPAGIHRMIGARNISAAAEKGTGEQGSWSSAHTLVSGLPTTDSRSTGWTSAVRPSTSGGSATALT